MFPDSHVGAPPRLGPGPPGGAGGEDLTVEFAVLGRAFVGLNGGPTFRPNEAVSFMVVTAGQGETDRYWDAIVGDIGQEDAGLVQGPLGLLVADRAAGAAHGVDRFGSRRRPPGHGGDDDDAED